MSRQRVFRSAILSSIVLSLFIVTGCAGRVLQVDQADEALKNEEYDKRLEIKESATVPPPVEPVVVTPAKKKKTKAVAEKKAKVKGPRQPDIEDSEGFEGRRPIKDPFRPGEKVTFSISYFNVEGGTLEMEVRPFVEVNGLKAYNFTVSAKSNSMFSRFYAVDDQAITYMLYDEMVPVNLQISIKESKQLAETRTLFDWIKMKAEYWQKQITKEKGERSKKIEWDIPAYSQNVVSVAYYLRAFKMEPGKKLAIRVADEGKNIVFTGEVLRREKLKTPIGELDTVVIKPRVTADGVFKPIGDILIWLTDDDRKFLVRLESKIKIGTVVAKLKSIEKGQD